jgi:hypothetical protein
MEQNIIVHYYEDTDNELRCNLTIPNIEKFNKMKKDLIFFKYEIDTESNKIVINVEKNKHSFSNDLLFKKTKQTKCFDEILFIIKIFLHSM